MSSKLRILGAIFLLCAGIMGLLVSLSTIPHLPAMDLVLTDFNTAGKSGQLSIVDTTGVSQEISEIRYGVWSACYSQGNNPDFTCFPKAVGYTFTIQLTNAKQMSATVTKEWTRALVIQPLGTAVTFLAIPFTIVECTGAWGAILPFISLIFGFVAMGIDIAFIHRLKNMMGTLEVASNTTFKPGFWMWLAAVCFVLFANLCFLANIRAERFGRLKLVKRLVKLASA